MIVGETRKLRHTETGTAAYTFAALPIWTVTLPDGSTEVSPGDFTVVDDPGYSSSAAAHIQSANIAFPQGGEYRIVRSMEKSDEGPILRIETYFAAWTDVYSLIRQRLQKTATQLPDAVIDPELAHFTAILLATYPCLESYNALSGGDEVFFDRAMALTVAANLHSVLPRTTATGEVKKKKLGDSEIEYAVSASGAQSLPLPAQWAQEAKEALGRVTCIRADHRSRAASYASIRISGPTRAARDAGCRQGMIDDLLRLIYPDWCAETED